MGWFLDSLAEYGIQKQTSDQHAQIDAVMFALWAQGHQERSLLRAAGVILIYWIIGITISILFLPLTILKNLHEVIFAAIITILIIYASNISIYSAAYVFSISYLLIAMKRLLRIFQEVFFDLGDFLTLGTLSRYYIKRHFALGPLKKIGNRNGLEVHLFESRLLNQGPYLAEIEALQQIVARKANALPEVEAEIDEYWHQFPPGQTFWRERLSRVTASVV